LRIIFEEHQYQAQDVKDILWDGAFESVEGKISINYVGYYFNPKIKDCVFILPRVLLEDVRGEELVFVRHTKDARCADVAEGLKPEDLIDPDACERLTDNERRFIYEFSVWIYRALDVFRKTSEDSSIILHKFVPIQGRGALAKCHTFLDVLLALVRFKNENRDFFVFTVRNRNTGLNRINWTRTIARTSSVISNGAPFYLNPVNKRTEIDQDDELFVIYYSILDHLRHEYGFPIAADNLYTPMPCAKFRRHLAGYGAIRLRQIKYKYFSDRALKLWELCFAFFQRNHPITINVTQQEYLLAKSFDRVFEAIIDELIGARESEIPEGLRQLKKQKDGKMVDHLYPYKGLTNNEDESSNVFYIGDSKYYKLGNDLGMESVSKQFTYARNVIQYNLDLFLDPKRENDPLRQKFPKLRDDVTEGYNIIPNFFISARMTEGLSYADDIVKASKRRTEHVSRQFENRLFDRDTLLLSHYDVNFLWVISLYARNNPTQKRAWCDKVRGVFRENIQAMLRERFSFSVMTPKPGLEIAPESFLRENFQQLLGKVFTPYADDAERSYYSLALQKKIQAPKNKPESPADAAQRERLNKSIAEENDRVLGILSGVFLIKDCELGENPKTALAGMIQAELEKPLPQPIVDPRYLTRHYIQRYPEDYFLVGYCRDDAHFRWIHSRSVTKHKQCMMYNVRAGNDVRGGVNTRLRVVRSPRFLILYNGDECSNPWECHVYRIRGVKSFTKSEMTAKLGYAPHHDCSYLCYDLDEEVSFGTIDIRQMIGAFGQEAGYEKGKPQYRKGAEIAAYVTG